MINVSEAYKNLVKQTFRPKCEPLIRVSGVDATGEEINLEWTAKDIKELTFKSGVDPLGRELPFMELSWTEIYIGDIPERYNKATQHLKVQLFFVQDLGFFNTWQIIKSTTWNELKKGSWRDVERKPQKEEIEVATLYLTAKPELKKQTIIWTARDFLSFLEQPFSETIDAPLQFGVPIIRVLQRQENAMSASVGIVDAIKDLKSTIAKTTGNDYSTSVVFDDLTKNLLVNYLKTSEYYLQFNRKSAMPKWMLSPIYEVINEGKYIEIFEKIIFSSPEEKELPRASAYSFKSYNGTTSKENYIIPDIGVDIVGEIISEDNKLYSYDDTTNEAKIRANNIINFFVLPRVVSFSMLSNLEIQAGDAVEVEIRKKDANGNKVYDIGVVTEMELKYSGALRQNLVVHTLRQRSK